MMQSRHVKKTFLYPGHWLTRAVHRLDALRARLATYQTLICMHGTDKLEDKLFRSVIDHGVVKVRLTQSLSTSLRYQADECELLVSRPVSSGHQSRS